MERSRIWILSLVAKEKRVAASLGEAADARYISSALIWTNILSIAEWPAGEMSWGGNLWESSLDSATSSDGKRGGFHKSFAAFTSVLTTKSVASKYERSASLTK